MRAVPTTPATSARKRINAADVPPDTRERIPTMEPELDQLLGGGFARKSKALLFGGDGAGKSRLGLRLATHLGPSLVISLEMPLELATETARHAGADLPSMFVVTEIDGWRHEAEGCTAILLDSISMVGRGAFSLLEDLGQWAEETSGVLIVIAQVNARGRPLGPNKLRHFPDYVIRASQSATVGQTRIRIQKSRYCPPGELELPIVGPYENISRI
jgi:predicted ATP-dependent serine protease